MGKFNNDRLSGVRSSPNSSSNKISTSTSSNKFGSQMDARLRLAQSHRNNDIRQSSSSRLNKSLPYSKSSAHSPSKSTSISSRIDKSRLSGGRLQRSNTITDARQLLQSKERAAKATESGLFQPKSLRINAINDGHFGSFDSSSSENQLVPPGRGGSSNTAVIVTGLGNVRRHGEKLEVVRPAHKVIARGATTLITLSNRNNDDSDRHLNDSRKQQQAGEFIELDKTYSSRAGPNNIDFKDIRIKFSNDSQSQNNNNNMTHNNNDNYNDSAMECDNNNYGNNEDRGVGGGGGGGGSMSEVRKRLSSTISTASNNNSNINDRANNSDRSGNGSGSGRDGFKLLVSNLHHRVTEDDVLELFSDIGPIKRARFVERGIAEVVYVKHEDAKQAIYKYDRNELDGRAMRIELYENSNYFLNEQQQNDRQNNNNSNNNISTTSHQYSSNNNSQERSSRYGNNNNNNNNNSNNNNDSYSRPSTSSSSKPSYNQELSRYSNNNSDSNRNSNSNNYNSNSHHHHHDQHDHRGDSYHHHQESRNIQSNNNNNGARTSSSNRGGGNTLSNRFGAGDKETTVFRLPDSAANSSANNINNRQKVNQVETGIIHQVLFNKKSAVPVKPVTFTVKL